MPRNRRPGKEASASNVQQVQKSSSNGEKGKQKAMSAMYPGQSAQKQVLDPNVFMNPLSFGGLPGNPNTSLRPKKRTAPAL